MADDNYDRITEDPDDAVEDDEMSPGEAGFMRGEEEAEQDDSQDDEVM